MSEHERPSGGVRVSPVAAGDTAAPLRALLDALPCLVATVAADETVTFVNDAARTWFGLDPETLEGIPFVKVIGRSRHSQARAEIDAVLAGIPQRFEQTITTLSGDSIHAQVDLLPMLQDGLPAGFHLLVNDISARVIAEATLKEAITTAALLEERGRIAADMHDRVIQKLYAAGLGAHRAKASATHATDWIDAIAECVDQAIGELRIAVRKLDGDPAPATVRGALSPIIRSATRWLGSEPLVSVRGPVDSLPADVVHDVLINVARMLATVGSRPDVSQVHIALQTHSGWVRLRVTDNGLPAPDSTDFGGVADLRRDAEARGGHLEVTPNRPRGTVMEWRVPTDDAAS